MHAQIWMELGKIPISKEEEVTHAEHSRFVLQERGLELSGMMLKTQQNPAIQYLKRKGILEPGRELSTSSLRVWWGK